MARKSPASTEVEVYTQAPPHYPWHRDLWEMIGGAMKRLPHALLLHGPSGLGKQAFALRFARRLICLASNEAGDACGECKSCRLLHAGTHPDLAIVTTPDDGKVIGVDQIRDLVDFMSLKPHTAAHKVAVLWPAQAMNVNAANSLLKILEEPPAGSFLLLVTDNVGRIPATIRSRCARFAFHPPARNLAIDWLEGECGTGPDTATLLALAGGAPLAAAALERADSLPHRESLLSDLENLCRRRESPCACAARWKSAGIEQAVDMLYGLAADLARLGTAGEAVTLSVPAHRERLQRLLKHIDLRQLYAFLDATSETRNLLRTPLDPLLLAEDLLIHWQRIASRIV